MYTSFLRVLLLSGVSASWLLCPPSFGAGKLSEGNQIGPCDGGRLDQAPPFVTRVDAGQRLKIAWPSNNLGGGLVRLALVPESRAEFHSAFDAGVIKMACYGHDERHGRFNSTSGTCNHPCNGRPGCHFQSRIKDVERYDTSIGIPTNLADGYYVLQWKALIANDPLPYYSCTKLFISGGDTSQICIPPSSSDVTCRVAEDGPKQNALIKGSFFGRFCFKDGGLFSNNVDGNICQVEPVNQACDARGDCAVASNAELCDHELIPIEHCMPSKAGGLRDSIELTSRRIRRRATAPSRLGKPHLTRRRGLATESSDYIARISVDVDDTPRDTFTPRYRLPMSSVNDESSHPFEWSVRRARRARRTGWLRATRPNYRTRHRRTHCRARRTTRVSSDLESGVLWTQRQRYKPRTSRCQRRRHTRGRRHRRRTLRSSDTDDEDELEEEEDAPRRRHRRRRRNDSDEREDTEEGTVEEADILQAFGSDGRPHMSWPRPEEPLAIRETVVLTVPAQAHSIVTLTETATATATETASAELIISTLTWTSTFISGHAGTAFVTATLTTTETVSASGRLIGDLLEPAWELEDPVWEDANPSLPDIDNEEVVNFDWVPA